jgi:hypothetical protein
MTVITTLDKDRSLYAAVALRYVVDFTCPTTR